MKFLLVLVVVLIGVFAWRSSRRERMPPPAARPKDATKVIDMASCDLCGLHCATTDMVVGRRGSYCSQQHRAQAEP